MATIQSLTQDQVADGLASAAGSRRWFIIADEYTDRSVSLQALVGRLLAANSESKALFLASALPRNRSADFTFETEHVIGRAVLEARTTESRIVRYAPSFALLRQLQSGVTGVDALSWREFEKLIAALVESDGYVVELMRGTKDGGVDVVAVRDLGPSGYFKAVWQAKKNNLKRKVQLSVVRELADTRTEFGASKGIVVTSSYLSRGALQRIERDKYILGKIDRDDLDRWIRTTLLHGLG